MHRFWRWILPCYLFTLPMTLAGFAISTLVYRAHSWSWYDGVLTCIGGRHDNGVTRIWGRPGAQTLGWIVIYASEDLRNEADLRVHEYAHVVQAFAGGIIGATLVPILFAAAGWSPALGLALGGFVGGLGFALVYGLFFLYLWGRFGGDWFAAYWAIPFEVQARAAQDAYLANPTSRPWGV